MAINEWRIWKRLGWAEEEREEVKIKDDLKAVAGFLKEIEVKELVKRLEKMGEMVKEEGVVGEELKEDNLRKQIEFFDGVLQEYSFFVNDADVNGLRLKKIAKELLRKAKEKGMDDLVKEKKKDIKWR